MSHQFENGTLINDSYRIAGELARGGMATVYRAHQISMNRDVAIKVLPREFLHEATFLDRFRQEASIAAKLEHRAIVPVYDYGEWNGTPYIVMRLMEGGSADGLLQGGVVDLETVQTIVRQISSALDYAHKQGVLHRDLKPSNILLDGNGDAYITDFGIARIFNQSEQLTASGVVGTPAYMSPEQAQGKPLDGRSDLYALGIVIFELLTGRRPFEAETPYSVAVMQVTETPPALREFRADIPAGVEAVVMQALEKDPAKRYRTATELAGMLEDADLMPATPAPTMPNPSPVSVTTPPPVVPTPQRGFTPVQPYYPTPPRRRRPSPILYLLTSVVIAIVLGGFLLGGYLLLTQEDTTNESPDFAATGVFQLTGTAANFSANTTSDGHFLFLKQVENQWDIFRYDLGQSVEQRLTDTVGDEGVPVVSSDGQWVAYTYNPARDDESQVEIYVRRIDGSETRQITSNLLEEGQPSWLLSGEILVYPQQVSGLQTFRLMRYDISSDEETTLYESTARIATPSVSPDGLQIAFAQGRSSEPASWEIWRLDVASGSTSQLTDNDIADTSPRWHPNGERILFLRDNASILEMRADGSDVNTLYAGRDLSAGLDYASGGDGVLFNSPSPTLAADIGLLWFGESQPRFLNLDGSRAPHWVPRTD